MARWDVDRIVGLTSAIYEVANGESDWKGLLGRMSGMFDASRACIQRFDTRRLPSDFESSVDEKANFIDELVAGGYSPVTPLTRMLATAPHGSIYREYEIVDRRMWRKSALWNDLMAPRDMYGGIGCRIQVPGMDGDWCIVDMQRGRNGDEFDAEELRIVKALAPALSRAVALRPPWKRPEEDRSADIGIFQQLPIGVAVITPELRVLRLNGVAELLMARHGLTISHGVLMTGQRGTTRQLQRLASDVCRAVNGAHAGGDMLLRGKEDAGSALVLSVVPLPSRRTSGGTDGQTAALYMRNAVVTPDSDFARRAARLFDLSPRESEVAAQLIEGLSLKEIAMAGDVSITTVRTQLGNLFRKTGTNRQSHLVMMLSRISDMGRPN